MISFAGRCDEYGCASLDRYYNSSTWIRVQASSRLWFFLNVNREREKKLPVGDGVVYMFFKHHE